MSQLLKHRTKWVQAFENGADMDTICLHFARASHVVDHEILRFKLQTGWVCGRVGRWIHSFVTGRTQCVVVDGTLSRVVNVVIGIPQGTVLGPLMFLIMISDINRNIT